MLQHRFGFRSAKSGPRSCFRSAKGDPVRVEFSGKKWAGLARTDRLLIFYIDDKLMSYMFIVLLQKINSWQRLLHAYRM